MLNKNVVIKIIPFLLGLIVVPFLILFLLLYYFTHDLPKLNSLKDYHPSIATQVYSRDGTLLTTIGSERREIVPFDQIPQKIIDSFLSAEDDNFYQHHGVDYWGIMRAMLMNLKAGRVVQGGSTITQQVAKSLLLSSERSLSRKIKDFLLARKIEQQLSKNDILFLYLNQVYLGAGFYGIKSAFEGYYGKTLNEATVAESAMIAGLLVAPGRYSPHNNPLYAKRRQEYVLGRMLHNKKISKKEYDEAVEERIKFRNKDPISFKAGFFTDWIKQRLISKFSEDYLTREGLKIKTTLDYEAQKIAEAQVLSGAKDTDKRQGYKGPILRNEAISDELFIDTNSELRKNLVKNNSEYFYIDKKLGKIFELDELIKEYDQNKSLGVPEPRFSPNGKFYPGNKSSLKMLKHLKEGQTYKAIVLKVDDLSRVITVSIGGAIGLIPYDYYKWARPREISDKRESFDLPTTPSQIAQIGDIVLAKVVKLEGDLKDPTFQFQKSFKISDEYKREKYLLLELDQSPEVQGALLSLNPRNGEIISLVGGHSFGKTQFNRALQSRRQPGSSFKPFIYAAALENGYTPTSIIMDTPEALSGVDETAWKPKNYDNEFLGPVTFRECLEQSRNIPTIKIAQALGVSNVINFSNRVGLSAKLDSDLSLALGSFGVTLLDLIQTYAVFPNLGKIVRPKTILSITDRNGHMIEFQENLAENSSVTEDHSTESNEPTKQNDLELEEKTDVAGQNIITNPFMTQISGDQVYDSRLAFIMTNILKGVIHGPKGTGGAARELSYNIAGKTGTTSNYVDAWFVGYSQNNVTGVWIGFDNNKTLGHGETGGRSALPIWREYMRFILNKYGDTEFIRPNGIVSYFIDRSKGELSPKHKEGFMESFAEGMPIGPTYFSGHGANPAQKDGQDLTEDDYYNNQ